MNAAWKDGPTPSEATIISNLRQSNQRLREALLEAQDKHKRESKAKAFTAFKRGMVIGAAVMAAAIFAADRAYSETISIGRHFIAGEPREPSFIGIEPSGNPGELAVVTFTNNSVNQEEDNGSRDIATPDVAVIVRFTFDYNSLTGADRITVIPPDGIICEPVDCGVTVMEGHVGQVILFDWRGM